MTLDNTLEIEAETRTGQIKIHGPEAFEGMRRAGRWPPNASTC
jgi:methionyl aminopeptidase